MLDEIFKTQMRETFNAMLSEAKEVAKEAIDAENVIDPKELARRLGVSTQTIAKECEREGFPVITIGASVKRFYWPDVLEFYRSNRPGYINEEAVARRKHRRTALGLKAY